jgi:hypothetical protein
VHWVKYACETTQNQLKRATMLAPFSKPKFNSTLTKQLA